jgi:hypothetical protein
MRPTAANQDLLLRAALALGPMTSDLMFVGGSVVGILAVEATSPPRPTYDVDVALEVATTIEYQTRIARRCADSASRWILVPARRYVVGSMMDW